MEWWRPWKENILSLHRKQQYVCANSVLMGFAHRSLANGSTKNTSETGIGTKTRREKIGNNFVPPYASGNAREKRPTSMYMVNSSRVTRYVRKCRDTIR